MRQVSQRLVCWLGILLFLALAWGDASPANAGIPSLQAVAVGTNGDVYVTSQGDPQQQNGGAVWRLEEGKAKPFAHGLHHPKGMVAFGEWLFVLDHNQVLRINRQGKTEVFVPSQSLGNAAGALQDLAVDSEKGNLYLLAHGNQTRKHWMLYRVTPFGQVEKLFDGAKWPELVTPAGIVLEGASHLLLGDANSGKLHRLKLAQGTHEEIASGLGDIAALAWDRHGRLFVADRKGRKVHVIGQPGTAPVVFPRDLAAMDLCLDATGKRLLVADARDGTVTALAPNVPGAEIDETPLQLQAEIAFPHLQWTGWKPESDSGAVAPLRPIVLTHAGDGGNRVFVATQHGVIHHFPDDQKANKTTVFLDIQERVRYHDRANEEGFLGLAFHPQFKKNGHFFVFYTQARAKHPLTNVLSRFKVMADDPQRADPASEEVLLTVERPFWNHDGGTIAFGPDGYLYVALGDGGAANDPFGNGQNLKTLLGSVLRLDVDRPARGKPYGIPKDNPFVGRKDAAPEIWAYGLRNVWRFSFDRANGTCWAADVGQNLWEEINILQSGGNYGWNLREALHPFGDKGVGPRPDLIDPVWEYHHDTGKSITGGGVYRGKLLPELQGAYVYADYVSGAVWALWYHDKTKRVTANRPIRSRNLPILSFGEDEKGEIYFLIAALNGQGIYRFIPNAAPAP